MKQLSIAVISMLLLACSQKEAHESFPILQVSDSEWATYEGTIITSQGELFDVELSLKEASVGVESYYRLDAILRDEEFVSIIQTEGKYIVTPGLPNHSFGIHLRATQTGRKISGTTYFTRNIPKVRDKITKPNSVESVDLHFSTTGNNQLVLTDDNFTPVASDARYTIYKRSRLFTVEGYVTIQPNDSSEFFERNTLENWNIVPLGEYNRVKRDYSKIATEPNEGIYLRALAYAISDTSSISGQRDDRLVLKQVIKIGASD